MRNYHNYETAGLFTQQPQQHGLGGARKYVQFWRATFSDSDGRRRVIRFPVPARWALLGEDLRDNDEAVRTSAGKRVIEAINVIGISLPSGEPDAYGTRWVDWNALTLTMEPEGPMTSDKFDFMHWRDLVREITPTGE